MRAGLADEFGVSRVTLFRRVGSREELISRALWRLTERMLAIAVERWEAERPEGERRRAERVIVNLQVRPARRDHGCWIREVAGRVDASLRSWMALGRNAGISARVTRVPAQLIRACLLVCPADGVPPPSGR